MLIKGGGFLAQTISLRVLLRVSHERFFMAAHKGVIGADINHAD